MTTALLPADFLIAGEVLMHQSLLLPAVKRDEGPAAAGTVYRIRFRESRIYAFKVAEFHCVLYRKPRTTHLHIWVAVVQGKSAAQGFCRQ